MIFCVVLMSACRNERQDNLAVLSDVKGQLSVVVLSAVSAQQSSLRNAHLVARVVHGLPSDVHVLILVNDRQHFEFAAGNRHVAFVEVPDAKTLSIWPQDPFVVVGNSHETCLLVPASFARFDDDQMANALAEALQIDVRQSSLEFEGGNIVVGNESVFIGFDTIEKNMKNLQLESPVVVDRFAVEFGRPVVVVGEQKQTIGHIDMVFTPLGDNKVAVADSRLGASIVKESLASAPLQIERFERRCEKKFFGHPRISKVQLRGGGAISRPPLVGKTVQVLDESLALASELDQIAQQVEAAGFNVVRIPALIPAQSDRVDEFGNAKPEYPFLTYNNVLMEIEDATTRIVYLPQYGLSTLDAEARLVWENLGYDVRPIRGFAISSMYGGALRCSTKVLSRE
jgi:hypothetical protein